MGGAYALIMTMGAQLWTRTFGLESKLSFIKGYETAF